MVVIIKMEKRLARGSSYFWSTLPDLRRKSGVQTGPD
jgi:hypothetical protein